MSQEYKPKLYYLIEPPHTCKIKYHPEAQIVLDFLPYVNYIIPVNVWDQYKDHQYYLGLYDFSLENYSLSNKEK